MDYCADKHFHLVFFSRMDILSQATVELSGRGLVCAAKWMAEQDLHVDSTLQNSLPISPSTPSPKPNSQDFKLFNLAKCMFQCREYDRVAHLLQGLTNKKCIFMRLYAKYLVQKTAFLLLKSVINQAGEKRKNEDVVDVLANQTTHINSNKEIPSIEEELSVMYQNNDMDGFLLYIYGYSS